MTASLLVEGGGLRGAFSAGALGELARAGKTFDDVVAVSSGAPSAAYFVSGQAESGLAIWREHTSGDRLISPANLLRGVPLMDIDGLIRVFGRVVPLDVQALGRAPTRLWVGVTDCTTGRARIMLATADNALELLRATMALPLAYGRIVKIDGVPYIDGGVAEALPLDHLIGLGRARQLLILTRPHGYRRVEKPLVARLTGWTYPRYPAVAKALAERSARSNATLERIDALEAAGALDVIRPAFALKAQRMSRRSADILATLDAGREAARAWIAKAAERLP